MKAPGVPIDRPRFLVEDDERDEVHFDCGSCGTTIVLLHNADDLANDKPQCPVCLDVMTREPGT